MTADSSTFAALRLSVSLSPSDAIESATWLDDQCTVRNETKDRVWVVVLDDVGYAVNNALHEILRQVASDDDR